MWLGAAMATCWFAMVGVSAAWAMLGLRSDDSRSHVGLALLMVLLILACLLVAMLLILESRAMFRRSANAAAMVGLVFALASVFALLAEAQVVLSGHAVVREITIVGAIAGYHMFCAFTHFRWAAMIAAWLTRTLEPMPHERI